MHWFTQIRKHIHKPQPNVNCSQILVVLLTVMDRLAQNWHFMGYYVCIQKHES